MRITKTLALAIALVLPTAVPTAVQAQLAPNPGLLTFGGDLNGNGTVNGFAVGPYKAQLDDFDPMLADVLSPNFTAIWCVDYLHTAGPNSWDSYYATAFAGNVVVQGNGDYSKTRKGNDVDYRKAAWLIERYDASLDNLNAANLFNAKNIQGTIWNMFGAALATDGTKGFFGLTVDANITLTQDWFVLTDYSSTPETGGDNQEFLTSRLRPGTFIVTTPEPSTYALMAAGLLAMGVVARRRRLVAKA